jgi:hypothetical protein
MLVSPPFRNMLTYFPLLLRECVVTASALEDDREGIGPSLPSPAMAVRRANLAGISNCGTSLSTSQLTI